MTENATTRKRLLSGMQPTGTGALHLGNLEGALRNWVRLQDEYEMFCMVADWHALTTMYENPENIASASRQVAADFIAGGLDPAKCAIFLQSQVKQHAELHLLLSMITPVGWLERVPTYKEKRDMLNTRSGTGQTAGSATISPLPGQGPVVGGQQPSQAQHSGDENISYGLLGYPCLQAADIIVYRAHLVPVGKDQAAHLEISREIARRFNRLYGNVFPEPQPLINPDTGVIPGIDGRKMSKSYGNAIYIADGPDTIAEKVKNAFTTPTKIRKSDPGVPENCVVCQLRRLYDPGNYQTSWEEDRAGVRGCMQNKKELTELLVSELAPMRARREELLADPAELDRILEDGANRARAAAEATMQTVRAAMHFS